MKTVTEYEWYKLSYDQVNSFMGIVKYDNGDIQYLENGELHRLDGPAIIWSDGHNSYYIYGKLYTKEVYCKHPEVIRNSKEFKEILKYKEML